MNQIEKLLTQSQTDVCRLIDALEKKDIEIQRLKDIIKVNEFHSNSRLNLLIKEQQKNEELEKKYNRDVAFLKDTLHTKIFSEDTLHETALAFKNNVSNRAYENFAKTYYEKN